MEHHVPRLPELMTNFWVTERHRGGLPARRHSAPNADFVLCGGPRSCWPARGRSTGLCVPRPGWPLSVSWQVGRSRAGPARQCSSATRTSFAAPGSDEPGSGHRDARQPRPKTCTGRWRCQGRGLGPL